MAACADSCITSPSLPVKVSLPLPSTTVASVLRMEPPTSVQARPVTSRLRSFRGLACAELEHAQVVANLVGLNLSRKIRTFFYNLACNLAADVADFALQVADASFSSVSANDLPDGFVRKLDILVGQASRNACFFTRNCLAISTFSFRVAVQPQNFHAVLQGWRDGMHHIRRGDEEDLRKIVFNVEIVIDEHKILFGIKHFQQRG